MQFLYREIDDIIGKGIGMDTLAELIMYASFTLVPYSLPLAVLIASIMTMGNLGERYELVAIKSSGISLLRAMRPLIILSLIMAGVAFFFSNNVMPYSLLKLSTLRYNISKKKPTMLLEEGVFFNDFENMTMKVERIGENDKLYDLTIYDHRKAGETSVIKADSAYIENSDTTTYMELHLMDGKMHQDVNVKNKYTRFGFKNLNLIIDMSGFEMGTINEESFKGNAKIKNVKEIAYTRDSLEVKLKDLEARQRENEEYELMVLRYENQDSLQQKLMSNDVTQQEENLNQTDLAKSERSITAIQSIRQKISSAKSSRKPVSKNLVAHKVAWYQKFALAFSCVVLFFIGAPMGALVRKGGFGLPIVISIIFYLIYYIINMTGTKFAEDGVLKPMIGIWLSTIILLPIAILLTQMAISDLKFDVSAKLIQPIQTLFGKIFTKK